MAFKSIIFLSLLLTSAASAEEKPNRAVALKVDAFKEGFRLCSRKGPEKITAYWELQQAEVTRIDRSLVKYIAANGLRSKLSLAPDGYIRQYLGLVRAGRRIAYVNAFPLRAGGEDEAKDKTQFAKWCDGGGLFWGIEYDMESGTFLDFAVNSSLQRDPLEGLRL
jgi:hypothetical protein